MATLKSKLMKAERAQSNGKEREKAQWIWQHRHGNLMRQRAGEREKG